MGTRYSSCMATVGPWQYQCSPLGGYYPSPRYYPSRTTPGTPHRTPDHVPTVSAYPCTRGMYIMTVLGAP